MIPVNTGRIVHRVLSYFDHVLATGSHTRVRNISYPLYFDGDTVGYFAGVELHGSCGAGMVIQLEVNHSYLLCMNADKGTNTRAELLALWGLLFFARNRGICL